MDPVYTISIIPTGMGAAGYTMPLPDNDEMFNTKNKMLEDITTLLGGRVAEEIIFGDITTGASNDIKRATETARSMVMKYGMSEKIGLIAYGNDDDEVFIGRDLAHTRGYSEEVAREIDGRFPVSSVSAMRMQRASSVRISAFFTAVRPFFSRRKRYIVKSSKHFLQQKKKRLQKQTNKMHKKKY